jgi:hypothetical protein
MAWRPALSSGYRPAFCSVDKKFFTAVKWTRSKVNNSLPPTAKVKNEWSYTTTPPYTFMAWKRNNFSCTFEEVSVFNELNKISIFNPLNAELNHICYLLALLGAHHFLHVSRIRVKSLTFRLLMSYIYGAPILDVSRSHTTTQHSR